MVVAGNRSRPQPAGDHVGSNEELLIVLVDERAWTREALARALEEACPELRVLRFGGLSELTEAAAQLSGKTLVLLNLSGIGLADDRVSVALASVRASLPGVPIVAIADSTDGNEILGAVERGLSGYIPNTLELRLVIEALRYVIAGGTFVPAEPVLAGLQAADSSLRQNLPAIESATSHTANTETGESVSMLNSLTLRESAVLEGVRRGESNKVIARELDLREPTVKVHIRHIMRKLGARNRTQIALIAERLRLTNS